MKKLAFVTRCVRQNNLEAIAKSLKSAIEKGHEWHVIFDSSAITQIETKSIEILQKANAHFYFRSSTPQNFGYDNINYVISEKIEGDPWLHIIDDDNTLHPDLVKEFESLEELTPCIVINQYVGGKDFTKLEVREAKPENMKWQGVDIAQVLIQKSFLLEKTKGFLMGYSGDGYTIEKLHKDYPESFSYIEKILCYYNDLEKPFGSEPRILYLGDLPNTAQTCKSSAPFESDKLNILYEPTEENLTKRIKEFNPDAIITRSSDWRNFSKLTRMPENIRRKWMHFQNDVDDNKGDNIYNVAMHAMLEPDTKLASIFTSAYNIKDKILRTYKSIAAQTYQNWEWVIVNDSTDGGATQKVLDQLSEQDPRVKVYEFRKKSGGVVGEAKYRAAALCKGEYLMEMDHDDELTEDAVELMVKAFTEYPDAGFVYSDCIESDEKLATRKYPKGFAFDYGNYYEDTIRGHKVSVCACVPVNPKTIRHIVGVPNHFRAWRRTHYFEIRGHNRGLTIADDYELIVRSFLTTRFVRIPKCCYIQYYHTGNTQNANGGATRKDIQRRVKTIANHYNERIAKRFEELGMEDWAYKENPRSPLNVKSIMDAPDAAYTLEIKIKETI
jgi:glycosyltransferase involved in cell wall biosynthesis